MPILHIVLAGSLGLFAPQDCGDWRECRDRATAAAAQQDYERFHDLSWRAVQRGPKNDPDLMLLLARAQALSGRPGDALVMLQRLAAMGVRLDATASDDFRRVRALPAWAELEQRITAATQSAVNAGPPVNKEPPTASAAPASAAPLSGAGVPRSTPGVASSGRSGTKALPPAAAAGTVPSAPSGRVAASSEAARFTAPGLTPDGLAYDGVSRRFLVADRMARKLVVVDEFSRSVATLAGAQAAFGDVEAMEIDARLGDLWVVSSEPPAAGGGATLHKLQLVSGRVIGTYTIRDPQGDAHFADVAVGSGSTVLVLDSAGSRVLRVRNGRLEPAAAVPPKSTSIAPAPEGTLFVASAEGIFRLDAGSTVPTPIAVPDSVSPAGISRLRYYRGSLIAVERTPLSSRLVRLRLDRTGRAVTATELLDTLDNGAGAFTIADDAVFYYASKTSGEAVLKKISLAKRP